MAWHHIRNSRRSSQALLYGLAFMLAAVAAADTANGQPNDPYRARRLAMVRNYLERDGITDKRVLESARTVPRHEFVYAKHRHLAYLDGVLPIGYKQTISPPFVVSYMTQTIEPKATDRVATISMRAKS